MKIETIVCRLNGSQELCETEVPDDWFEAPTAKVFESTTAADSTSAAE